MKYGKLRLKLALLIAATGCGSLPAAQTLETFDDLGAGNAFFVGSWEANDSLTGTTSPATGLARETGMFTIAGSGVRNDADSFLELHFATPIDLGTNDAISVTAEVLAGNEASSFEVRLFDTSGGSAFATIETAVQPMVGPLIAGAGFNAAAVEIVRISGARIDSADAFAVRFDTLEAADYAAVAGYHDADFDHDFAIGLSELLRVIELYNTRLGTSRTGRYQISAGSVDGFASDPTSGGPAGSGRRHSADSNGDLQISLGELLRVIELYNTRAGSTRTGIYHAASGTADGFSAGPRS